MNNELWEYIWNITYDDLADKTNYGHEQYLNKMLLGNM